MLDFNKINAFEKGQEESFENLVCVLAKRERFEKASEFQPNDGSGGDGGMDAIWLLTDGGKIGFQAKFFLSMKDSHWQQMDNSVEQALKVHPDLQKYIIALPCDLTPDRGKSSRGKSGWQKWNERIEKWKGWATEKSINVEFKLWSATILEDKLLRAENMSIRKHWFGGDILDDNWFKKYTEVAIQKLSSRFNPGNHVAVSIEDLFDAMNRGPKISNELNNAFAKFKRPILPNIELTNEELAPDADAFSVANKTWQKLIELKYSFSDDFSIPWNINLATTVLNKFRDAVIKLEKQYRIIDKRKFLEDDGRKLETIKRNLSVFTSSCYSLSKLFESRNLCAEAERCALIYGPAGAGKSHTLGWVAEQRILAGLPTVLMLGQDFSDRVFWEQMGVLLGIEGRTADDILGALNAAGIRKRKRTVLLFDAINEGANPQYWRQNLPQIINAVKKYTHLAFIFSCREEYVSYTVPEELSQKLPKFEVTGYSTPEEFEEAAIQYLDSKGIVRPNTPWLLPELSNPLFLKSASEALQNKKLKEFPRGLYGISKIMDFYLDALSWSTNIASANPSMIAHPIKECVRLMAEKMASKGCDFVNLEEAKSIAKECFSDITPPQGKSWLDVLVESSLFRFDVPPYRDNIHSLNQPPPLVRFAFQKFQEHFMAISLVKKISKDQVSKAFDKDEPLNFLFYDGDPIKGFILDEYAGLVNALSIIFPEKLGIEFAKALPNWERHWELGEPVQTGFGESFKRRSLNAFLEDTQELFNRLGGYRVDSLELTLEVSMAIGHPFNALNLHSCLKRRNMPERDSCWTQGINWLFQNKHNQTDRIISWALSIRNQNKNFDVKHLELASIVLTWFLASSHITLRDRATKALITLFLENSNIFIFVLEKMHDCNDPYVIERLYAAAFGACCIDPTPNRLKTYSNAVFAKVFAERQPPVALLTRDYALGIIELAESKNILSDDVNLNDCYHPLNSNAPVFSLTEKEVKDIAKAQGGEEIFWSALGEWDDFGKYIIPGRVDDFLITPLSQEPISKEELKQTFVEEVISPHDERVTALEKYKNATGAKLTEARQHLENLLNKKEQKRLYKEYFYDGVVCYENFDKIDVKQCRLWIAKRAYELGWNSELFPRDEHGVGYLRHQFESISKKYQRIALDEIQARLADNYWVLQDWPKKPYIYRYSHQNFRRNLEPTILPTDLGHEKSDSLKGWIVEPIIKLPKITEVDLKQWPFEKDPTHSISDKLWRTDEEGKRWLVLYESNSDKQQHQNNRTVYHDIRFMEFRLLFCVFLKRGKTGEIVNFLRNKRALDVHSFRPESFTSGPYLLEAYWRDTWQNIEKFSERLSGAPDGCNFATPVAHYYWEGTYDKTLPDGFSKYIPQKWFASELDLLASRQNPHAWVNQDEKVLLQSYQASGPFDHQDAVVIDEKTLFDYAKEFEVEPLWLMIAERNAWPNAGLSSACWRRSEGIIWRKGKSWKQIGWNDDMRR